MVYKQYVNNDFRLLVKTWMFLTLDLYVMKFKNQNSDFFYDDLSDKLFTNEQDIDLMNYWYNPTKMMEVVTGVDKKSEETFRVGRKTFDEITIESHNDLYDMHFPNDIKDVYIVWLKRFDKSNYIAPVAIRVDYEWLLANNHNLNLGKLFQENDNTADITNLLTNFRKAIFI